MPINCRIEKFLQHHAIPPSRFGRMVARDPRLVHDMRNGRRLGPAMIARVEALIAGQENHGVGPQGPSA